MQVVSSPARGAAAGSSAARTGTHGSGALGAQGAHAGQHALLPPAEGSSQAQPSQRQRAHGAGHICEVRVFVCVCVCVCVCARTLGKKKCVRVCACERLRASCECVVWGSACSAWRWACFRGWPILMSAVQKRVVLAVLLEMASLG